jgi:adenylate cyclase
MKFSIFSKLSTVIVSILILTVFPITQKSISIFEASARRSAEDLNMSLSSNKSQEFESLFLNTIDKAKTVGTFMIKESNVYENPLLPLQDNHVQDNTTIDTILKMDKDLWAIELYKVENSSAVLLKRKANELKFKQLKMDSTVLDKIKKQQQINFNETVNGDFSIHSIVQNKEFPLLVFSAPLTLNAQKLTEYFVTIYIDISKVQSLLLAQGQRKLFITKMDGSLIAHSEDKITLLKQNFKDHPAVAKAIVDSSPKKQVRYLGEDKKYFNLSSYTKSSLGLIFISEVSEKSVLLPIRKVKQQSIYIAGIIISFMLILTFFFSITITNPIEILSELALQIKKGNFTSKAKNQIYSKDEVGQLAHAFDDMVDGLKERDKVKNLFNKFHGSSITDEMLQGEIAVKGSNKNITVFFSDVRGFTAFSEGHTPEEVVSMLNEYFAIMVRIINKNNGVVDKFIGDAIMAVWGAPKSTGNDTYWCIKACLEMRKALNDLNELRITRGQTPIMIGMGVHAGPAISGTIGSEERMEYTVIGDTVNQTSRIEASTKAFGADLLISNEAAEEIKSNFKLEFAGSAEVKGKVEALKLYKVRGYIKENGEIEEVKTPYSDYEKEKADKIKVVA